MISANDYQLFAPVIWARFRLKVKRACAKGKAVLNFSKRYLAKQKSFNKTSCHHRSCPFHANPLDFSTIFDVEFISTYDIPISMCGFKRNIHSAGILVAILLSWKKIIVIDENSSSDFPWCSGEILFTLWTLCLLCLFCFLAFLMCSFILDVVLLLHETILQFWWKFCFCGWPTKLTRRQHFFLFIIVVKPPF